MTNSTAEAGIEEVEEEVEETVAEEESEEVEESSELETDEEEAEEQEEEDQEIEFDFFGNKHAVKKDASVGEIAEELQSYAKGFAADYTKKSQAVAETKQSLEAREKAIEKLEGLHGETLDVYSRGLALGQELSELGTINMSELWQSDPDQARRVSDMISQKQADYNMAFAEVNKKNAELDTARQEEIQRRVKEGKELVSKQIPDFEVKHVPKVKEYVKKNFGVSDEDAELWALNPGGAIMAYESMLYRDMQAKAKQSTKKVKKEVKPVKAIKGKGSKTPKPLSKVEDPHEYRQRWMAQQKRKAAGK